MALMPVSLLVSCPSRTRRKAPDLDQNALDHHRAQLDALRLDLVAMIADTAAGTRPVDLDEPIGRLSRMDALQQQSMTTANRNAAMRRLQQVDAALRRLADDSYGECANCGDAIDPRRLEAKPEAPLCVACQSARER